MSRVFLVRHGTHGLVGKALAGRMPGVSLSAEGREEAERLATYFAGMKIARILSSPLERCRETAAPIATRLGLPVEDVPDLVEIDCGEWTGRDFAALASDPRWHAWNSERDGNGIPGGETVRDVQTRVMRPLQQLADKDDATIIVSHSDVIKVAVMTLLGTPLRWHDRIEIDPASITTVDLWQGGGKLVRLNEAVS
jgi:broad specificity phosphatase PhoE